MKTSRYTEAQILAILRQAEGGMPVAELCRAHGMSSASFYKWRGEECGGEGCTTLPKNGSSLFHTPPPPRPPPI